MDGLLSTNKRNPLTGPAVSARRHRDPGATGLQATAPILYGMAPGVSRSNAADRQGYCFSRRPLHGGDAVGARPDGRLDGPAAHPRQRCPGPPSSAGSSPPTSSAPRPPSPSSASSPTCSAGAPSFSSPSACSASRLAAVRRGPTLPLLVAFRGLQGVGAGAIQTCSLIVMGDMFPPRQRAPLAGHQQHRLRHRQRRRPVRRRLPRRQLLLALDLPAQRAAVHRNRRRAALRPAAAEQGR